MDRAVRHALQSEWLRIWLIAANAVLVAVALGLAVWVSRRALFLVALVPIAFGPFSYARWRLHAAIASLLDARRSHRTVVVALGVLGCLFDAVMVAQLLTARSSLNDGLLHAPGVSWIGPVWFSAHAFLFAGYALLGAARRSGRLIGRLADRVRSLGMKKHADPFLPERREFLRQFGIAGAGVPFFVSLSGVRVSYDFRVEEKEIALPAWPPELDGFRIAHLSDIHVGGAMDRKRLLEVARLTNAAGPDLVLHTGDFLTHRAGNFDAPLYEALARIDAPLGQFACLGNHDFDDVGRLVRRLADAGVVVLRNTMTALSVGGQAVELAGIDFVFARFRRAAEYARIVAGWPERRNVPRILLNHDPTGFDELPDGVADLVLSGHTHGGHVGVQLGPDQALTVVGLAGIPDQGIFRRGSMQMFVTRCVGFYGYPMRVGIPPEIAVLTLRASRETEPTLEARARAAAPDRG